MVLSHAHSLLSAVPKTMPHHAKLVGPIMGGAPEALPMNLIQVRYSPPADCMLRLRHGFYA